MNFIFSSLSQIDLSPLPGANGTNLATSTEIGTVISIFFGVLGALAFLMIVISGLRYITSTGDPQKTATAKNGIIYALIGLAIALSAETIVGFVVGKI
jgi:hypothetical protein